MAIRNLTAVFRSRDETGPGARSAEGNVGRVTTALNKAKLAAAALAAAAGAALLQIAQGARESVRDIGAVSNALQIGVEEASRYAFAARRAGIELNDFSTVLQRIVEIQQVDARDSEPVRNALQRIGIDPDDPAFLQATTDDLADFIIEAFRGANAQVASATADELGITNLDLNALIKVQAQVAGVPDDAAITSEDIINETTITLTEARIRELFDKGGNVLLDGASGWVEIFDDIWNRRFNEVFGLNAENAAREFVSTFGEELGVRTEQDVLDLYEKSKALFIQYGGNLGSDAASAFVLNYFKGLEVAIDADRVFTDPGQDIVAARQVAQQYTSLGLPVPAEIQAVINQGRGGGLDNFFEGGANPQGDGRYITDFDRRAHARYQEAGGQLTISNWIDAGRPRPAQPIPVPRTPTAPTQIAEALYGAGVRPSDFTSDNQLLAPGLQTVLAGAFLAQGIHPGTQRADALLGQILEVLTRFTDQGGVFIGGRG